MNTTTERTTTPDGFIERATITHDGQAYTAGGAFISEDALICYPAHGERWQAADGQVYAGWAVTWSGQHIGNLRITGHARGFHDTRLTCYRVTLTDGRAAHARNTRPAGA